jgi:hypothetical protein
VEAAAVVEAVVGAAAVAAGVRENPIIRSGRMTSGVALVAWPARYASTGIMTFLAGPDGDVYQKDLGRTTAGTAAAMKTFDPDLSWVRVEETND